MNRHERRAWQAMLRKAASKPLPKKPAITFTNGSTLNVAPAPVALAAADSEGIQVHSSTP